MPRLNNLEWELDEAERLAYDHFHGLLDVGYPIEGALWCVKAIHTISDDFAAWLTAP